MSKRLLWISAGCAFISVLANGASVGESFLTCQSKAFGWTARLEIHASTQSQLTLTWDNKKYRCPLKLSEVRNEQSHVRPLFWIQFAHNTCVPALGREAESKLLANAWVRVFMETPAAPVAQIRWLRHRQPALCRIESFHRSDLQRLAEHFELRD